MIATAADSVKSGKASGYLAADASNNYIDGHIINSATRLCIGGAIKYIYLYIYL